MVGFVLSGGLSNSPHHVRGWGLRPSFGDGASGSVGYKCTALACAQGKRCLSLLRVLYKQGLSEREELIKHVDLGIALSHFHQTALEHGLTGTFESLPQHDITLPDKMHYILSWHVGKEE